MIKQPYEVGTTISTGSEIQAEISDCLFLSFVRINSYSLNAQDGANLIINEGLFKPTGLKLHAREVPTLCR